MSSICFCDDQMNEICLSKLNLRLETGCGYVRWSVICHQLMLCYRHQLYFVHKFPCHSVLCYTLPLFQVLFDHRLWPNNRYIGSIIHDKREGTRHPTTYLDEPWVTMWGNGLFQEKNEQNPKMNRKIQTMIPLSKYSSFTSLREDVSTSYYISEYFISQVVEMGLFWNWKNPRI